MIQDAPETERRRLRRLLDSLPERQSQCACWAFHGMSNKEIGHEIGCATRTVKAHLSKVYARLGLQHNSALFKRAIMVKTMIDTSKYQEVGAEMSHLFSPHQIDVLDLVSEGLKNKEIARCLSMSENMIKNDLRRIFDLAGCDTRVEVVVWWRNHRGRGNGTVNSRREARSAPLLSTQISVGMQHATTCALETAISAGSPRPRSSLADVGYNVGRSRHRLVPEA